MNSKSFEIESSPSPNKFASAWAGALALVFSLAFLTAGTVFAESSRDSLKTRAPKSEHSTDEIAWLNYEDGVKLAQEQNKQILIDFSTSWCGYCKKMDRETFKDSKVIDFINTNFIAIKIDGDSKREIEIDGFSTTEKRLTKEMYGVTGYPTFWFLESDGSKIGKQPGYQPAQGFLELLTYVTEKKYLEGDKGSEGAQDQ